MKKRQPEATVHNFNATYPSGIYPFHLILCLPESTAIPNLSIKKFFYRIMAFVTFTDPNIVGSRGFPTVQIKIAIPISIRQPLQEEFLAFVQENKLLTVVDVIYKSCYITIYQSQAPLKISFIHFIFFPRNFVRFPIMKVVAFRVLMYMQNRIPSISIIDRWFWMISYFPNKIVIFVINTHFMEDTIWFKLNVSPAIMRFCR